MKTVTINRFDGGVAESNANQSGSQFTMAKHFDTTTFPHKLSPYRGMATDETNQTGIGNLLIGSDGKIYGLGTNGAGTSRIYYKTSFTDSWATLANSTVGTSSPYTLFIEYKSRLYYADSVSNFWSVDITGATAITNQPVTYTRMGPGVVHPKDDMLYIAYDNKIARNNAGSWDNDVLDAIPSYLTITGLAPYGNYLAIACTPTIGLSTTSGGGAPKSIVYLWDRDTSLSVVSESIDWGTGVLRVLNNYDGVLVGLSDSGGTSANVQDRDSISIKGWAGGQPFLIKELSTQRQTTTVADAAINPRVSFVYRNKYYFSINLVGGSTSPAYYGLWSLSRSKIDGSYSVTIERTATNANTETGVLAACIAGDACVMVHSNVGTVVTTINTSDIGSVGFQATSSYDSVINPGMPIPDYYAKKQLMSVSAHFSPLVAGTVVMKYRVDGGAWTTIFTKTASSPDTDTTGYEATKAGTDEFTSGRQYEFRLESTGGAEIIAYTYKYNTLQSNI